MNLEEKMKEYKELIERQKRKLMECKGELKVLTKRLKDEFGIENVKEAEKELKKLKKKEQELRDSIERGLEELESKLKVLEGELNVR